MTGARGLVIAYSVTRQGRYAGATETTLELLGYQPSEFLHLPVGSVTGQPEQLARGLWERYHAGTFRPPVGDPALLHRKGGGVIAARFQGITEAPEGIWTLSYRVLSGGRVQLDRPRAVAEILRLWRVAEAALAALPVGHPDREGAQHEVEEWADLHRMALDWQERRRRSEEAP